MWAVREPDRFTRALRGSHTVRSRVELWSQGTLLSDDVPFTDGQVTDTWVIAGVRRTLDLTIVPTRDWLAWLDLPLLELRPYRGIAYSRSAFDECPLGRYPFLAPEQSRPVGTIKIGAEDYYQRIVQSDLGYMPWVAALPVTDALLCIITPSTWWAAGMLTSPTYPPLILTDNRTVTPLTLLQRTRHDGVVDYCKSYGLEVYLGRDGRTVIADTAVLGAPVAQILAGPGESAEGIQVKPDWSKVFNQVAVTSSAQDADFPAQGAVAPVTSPAAQWRIGARVKKYSSPLLFTPEAAMKAANTILARVSASAVTFAYTCIPDPRLDAGDSILGSTMTGTTTAQIATVTHPLTAAGHQQITTVSTQAPDEG